MDEERTYPENPESFAENFDIILIVRSSHNDKATPTSFGVIKTVLCLASPVFKAMLEGEFLERNSKALTVYDDDANGMRIFLNIAHLRFDTVADLLTSEGLIQVLPLVDKYCASSMLKPWAKHIYALAEQAVEQFKEGKKSSIRPAMFLSWTLHMRSQFNEMFSGFLLRSTVDDQGNYRYCGTILNDEVMPSIAYEHLVEARCDLYGRIDSLFAVAKADICDWVACEEGPQDMQEWCSATMHGSFHREVQDMCTDSTLESLEQSYDLSLMVSQLSNVRVLTLRHEDHTRCHEQVWYPHRFAEVIEDIDKYLEFGDAHFSSPFTLN